MAVVCAAIIGGIFWYRARTISPRELFRRLPEGDAVVFYIDFAALRRGGLMQIFDSAKSPEDPEYLRFVQKTSFNYKQDLDAVLGEYGPGGWNIFARGRFDWQSLRRYTESQQGSCPDAVCRMAGSTPDRRISFLPIQSRLMALSVGRDETAVLRLAQPGIGPEPQLPDAPVWAMLPPSLLRSAQNLPDGTRPFARAVGEAELITLAFTPEDRKFALNLTLKCRSDQDAYDAASQLSKVTELLRHLMLEQHAQPKSSDLAWVLESGRFWNKGDRAYGVWPIDRPFLETLLK
jgi:hypothetical protein